MMTTIAIRLADFQQKFPEIVLELSFNEAFVDVIAEGFHAGFRMGDLVREDMIAVRISRSHEQVFFAAPLYFDRYGRPKRPVDLLQHNCIRYGCITSKQFAEWRFQGADDDVSGNLTVDESMLDRHALEQRGYFLYYPKANGRIDVLRAFIDFMKQKP